MNLIQAVGLAVLQGATELFPVSSLGHAVVLPALLGWSLDQQAPSFLPFLVMLHLGTAAALLIYFWRDWWALFIGVIGAASPHQVRESRRVFWLVVIATIPAVIVGFLFEHILRRLFGSPIIAAEFLIANGLLLLLGERLRGQASLQGRRALSSLTLLDALAIGCWQCAALIPGISRSGSTIVGGLLRGINHADAAHFSFLIATPIILGAGVLEVPKLRHLDAALMPNILSLSVIAAIVAGITAFASTAFLMRYFRDHDNWALDPFAYYCLLAGAGSVVALVVI